MAIETTNYGLVKDDPTEFYDVGKVNDNLDKIDEAIKAVDDKTTDFSSQLGEKTNPNSIINGCFRINQRSVSGTVTLSAGVYGHDRWKAGSNGCTYTFTSSEGITTINITAGSLLQIIEGINLQKGNYALSWEGTTQGKIGNGSYAPSVATASISGGANLTIEFGVGTLSNVKFEKGTKETPFIQRSYGEELELCKRYYEVLNDYQTHLIEAQYNEKYKAVRFGTEKRIAPSVTLYAYDGTPNKYYISSTGLNYNYTIAKVSKNGFIVNLPTDGATVANTKTFGLVADAEI